MTHDPVATDPGATRSGPLPRTAAVVAPSPVPLRLGGAERHWETLRRSLEDAGIAADLVKLPVREFTLPDLLQGYEDFRLLDLSHVDLVISGKYPAWMVQHPNHVVWMLHPLRGLYDTYRPAAHEGTVTPAIPEFETLEAVLSDGPRHVDPLEVIDLVRAAHRRLGPGSTEPGGPLAVPSPLAAAVVHLLDHWALGSERIRRHFAISDVVAARHGYFPAGVTPEVIIPPSCLEDPDQASDPGAGLLSVGRLDGPKRVDLAISAFRRIGDPGATLTVLGDGPDRERLVDIARGDNRISFAGRVSDEELRAAYRDCRAVLVTPADEDFGYVAIEAMQAGRPVITTTDSGGPAALVASGRGGLVVDPDAGALAEASAELLRDDQLARRLGEAGSATAEEHSWPNAATRLVEARPPAQVAAGRRGRIVAVSTYPVADWPGGGPERARHLLAGLAEEGWEVQVVAIAPQQDGHRVTVSDGLSEVSVPLSGRHATAERRLRRLTANIAVTDITTSLLWSSTPDLVRELGRALEGASAAVAVQPYLAPAVLDLAPRLPLILDDHNHERTLKAQMLPDDEAGRWMLDRVADAEGSAAAHAALVVATTAEDARALEADNDLAAGTVAVVPNGVDLDMATYTSPEHRASLRDSLRESLDPTPETAVVALFVGSAHRPNVDAAREIVALAPEHPTVLFALVGEHTDQLDNHEVGTNVRLLGAVDHDRLSELLAGADVALNPMRTGGGSNLKVLQYFAAGLPVLSTPLGVRGVPEPGRHAVVARVDLLSAGLAEMTAEIVAESPPAGSGGRVEAARKLVETEFDWAVIAHRFATLTGRAVEDREPAD